MAIIRVKPGIVTAQDGTYPELRGNRKGAILSQDAGGRLEEAAYRGNVYSSSGAGGGIQLAATHLFSTAIATFTPLLLIYNPLTSPVNLSILTAWCSLSAAPLATTTQTGSFLWVVQSGQSITNAQSATPVNHKTLKASGSQAVGITNTTLTGAVGNPILLRPVSGTLEIVTATANATAVASTIASEPVDGGIVVPPGGYAGFANGISNAVAGHLVTCGITWEEIPL